MVEGQLSGHEEAVFLGVTEIMIIAQLLSKEMEALFPNGLTVAQFTVLNHLIRTGDGKSPVRIASAVQVRKSTMTNTVQNLVKSGLVSLDLDPADGRGKIVRLTDAGKEARNLALAALKPLQIELAHCIEPDGLAQCLPVLRSLRVYLDARRD